METMIHAFLPSFFEISKTGVIKLVHVVHHDKKGQSVFGCFFQKKFIGHCFPIPIPLPSFVQMRPVSDEIYAKMSPSL